MQLIILLSSQSATFRDTESANLLLRSWLGNQYNASSKLRPLALLFDNYLSEVRRMDGAIVREAGLLAESADIITRQAEELTNEREKRRDEQRQKQALLKQKQALQKKLDALLEMEMNLIER
jgi:septal ring factor EnvC (AmiA/AmiB activator)